MDKTRILVVDDNATIRRGLSVRLRSHGYEVLFAEDAVSATAALVAEKPDLVILDLGLPCGDGFVVMERLQKNDHLAQIPVIVLTGREVAGDRDRALEAGAAAFLQKPVDDDYLLLAIRKLTHILKILVVDDNLHLQVAFKRVLTSSGYQVELAGDGEEGLRLAASARPDVILLDMMLPKLGGLDVLRALKADNATRTIPVIALSGLPMSNEARLRRDGAIKYLQKSNLGDLDVLLQAIDYALLLPRDNEFSQEAFLPNLTWES